MRRALVVCVSLAAAILPAQPALADHVAAGLQVSARFGERLSDNSWAVIVDSGARGTTACSGAPDTTG